MQFFWCICCCLLGVLLFWTSFGIVISLFGQGSKSALKTCFTFLCVLILLLVPCLYCAGLLFDASFWAILGFWVGSIIAAVLVFILLSLFAECVWPRVIRFMDSHEQFFRVFWNYVCIPLFILFLLLSVASIILGALRAWGVVE